MCFKSIIPALRRAVNHPHLGLLNSGVLQHGKPCSNAFELTSWFYCLKGHWLRYACFCSWSFRFTKLPTAETSQALSLNLLYNKDDAGIDCVTPGCHSFYITNYLQLVARKIWNRSNVILSVAKNLKSVYGRDPSLHSGWQNYDRTIIGLVMLERSEASQKCV